MPAWLEMIPLTTIDFFVPGTARSTQTGSVVRAGTRLIPIRRNTAWSAYIALVAKQHAPPAPLTGAVAVAMDFHLARPKTSRRKWPTVRPDLDNLSKGLMDAMNGILWADDGQVVQQMISKRYADHPGLQVTVSELES